MVDDSGTFCWRDNWRRTYVPLRGTKGKECCVRGYLAGAGVFSLALAAFIRAGKGGDKT